MKVVLLIAGRGRRLGNITKNKSKALIDLNGKPLLAHLIERFIFCNLKDIIVVVGHDSKGVIEYINNNYGNKLRLTTIFNSKYKQTNNLYSLWLTREYVSNNSFIVCNGDTILNKYIINNLLTTGDHSAIVIDDKCKTTIDSPGTIIKDGRILDLGRHIPKVKNGGYAMGLYKFGPNMSKAFFDEADRMINAKKYNAGFHDPLLPLFRSHEVLGLSTNGLSWTDLDTEEDIPYAKNLLKKILIEEKQYSKKLYNHN